MRIGNRRIWLVGASSGIGAALAPLLAERGARLTLSARTAEALERLAAALPAGARVIPLDVTEPGALAAAYGTIRAADGGIDVLIYNAGAWQRTDLDPFDLEAAETQIAVNYVGLVRAVDAVLPDMLERASGAIVGVGSLSSYVATPGAEVYGSTKAAANAFLQALRIDLAPRGIEVVIVNPGFVETPLTAANDFPMPFLLAPDDAARRIVAGLEAGRAEIHFPRRLSWPLKLARLLPGPVYERLAARLVRA